MRIISYSSSKRVLSGKLKDSHLGILLVPKILTRTPKNNFNRVRDFAMKMILSLFVFFWFFWLFFFFFFFFELCCVISTYLVLLE